VNKFRIVLAATIMALAAASAFDSASAHIHIHIDAGDSIGLGGWRLLYIGA
jgi:hypothetical protein